MKKRTLLSFILCITMITVMTFITGCEKEQTEDTPSIDSINITFSINYPEASELADETLEPFAIEEDSTVLEITQLYCNINDMPLHVETTSGTVVGINDLLNGDVFAQRTWQFKLNGKLTKTPARQVELHDGDQVEWVYVK